MSEEGASVFDALTASAIDLVRQPVRSFAAGSSAGDSSSGEVIYRRSVEPRSTLHADDAPPELLGDYRIVREIGRGGMGIVYEARQLSLGRTIALKVLPFAAVMDEKQVARFHNEAQAAAQLHHPNIVPVIGVGCDRGVHYYSMQLIEGQPLDQAITELRLLDKISSTDLLPPAAPPTLQTNEPEALRPASGTVRPFSTERTFRSQSYIDAAVKLMLQAADALHYAHESGVIHRDIKPSNLLVDRRGKLWITDFGLARSQSLTSLTAAGDVFGTLRYMSPEQAAGNPLLVDHRADVYSLGVTLYEMLTMRTPFHSPQRLELLRQIEHDDPPTIRSLNSAVSIDLETIVLKCLAKSRDDRYATAEALANDLRCYLEGQPTEARRPTLADRAAKWVCRRAKLVAGCLVGLTVTCTAMAVGAALLNSEHAKTQAALDSSQRNLRAARAVVDDFNAELSEELAEIPGAESVRLAALQRAERFYSEFLKHSEQDPAWSRDAAIATFKRAAVLEQLGDLPGAQNAYELARRRFLVLLPELNILATAQRTGAAPHLPADLPARRELETQYALCLNGLAMLHARRSQTAEAIELLGQAHYLLQRAITPNEDGETHAKYLHDFVLVQANLGIVHQQVGNAKEASHWLKTAVAAAHELMTQSAGSSLAKLRLATVLQQASAATESPEEAVVLLTEAVSVSRQLAQQHPQSLRSTYLLCTAIHGWGSVKQELNQTETAVAAFEEALQLERQLIAIAPRVVSYRTQLAATLNNLGMVRLGEAPEAAGEYFAEACELLERAVRQSPGDFALRSEWAIALNNQGLANEKQGELKRAEGLYQRAVAEQTMAAAASGHQPHFQELIQRHQSNLTRLQEDDRAAVAQATAALE